MNLKSMAAFLALSIHSMSSSATSPAHLLFPLKQVSFEVNPNESKKQQFIFDIKSHCFSKRCPVKFGLEYASKQSTAKNAQEKNAHIRNFFFSESGHRPKFPLEIGFELHDANSQIIIINTKPSGELRNGYIYGGATVTSILGGRPYYCITPGEYNAELQILSTERDTSELTLNFVVINDFKVTCGD